MPERSENARYEQFLLFPQCFQKTCTADTLQPEIVCERVKKYKPLTLSQTSPIFSCLQYISFESTVGKGEKILETLLIISFYGKGAIPGHCQPVLYRCNA